MEAKGNILGMWKMEVENGERRQMKGVQTLRTHEPPPLFGHGDNASAPSFQAVMTPMKVDLNLDSYQPHQLPAQAPSSSVTLGQPAEATAPPAPVVHPPSVQRPAQAPQPLPRQQVQTLYSHQQQTPSLNQQQPLHCLEPAVQLPLAAAAGVLTQRPRR